MQWMCGPVDSVSGSVREVHGYDRIDDVAIARLDFADGGIASLTSIWHDIIDRPSLRNIEIFSENLYLHLDGEATSPLTWQFTGEPVQTLEGDALARACIDAGTARERDLAPVAGGATRQESVRLGLEALVDDRVVGRVRAGHAGPKDHGWGASSSG